MNSLARLASFSNPNLDLFRTDPNGRRELEAVFAARWLGRMLSRLVLPSWIKEAHGNANQHPCTSSPRLCCKEVNCNIDLGPDALASDKQ